jgi:molecular chaperone HtpG
MWGVRMTSKVKAFEADTGKILSIVINSLYSDKEIFLRELLSNASDALNKRQYLGQTNNDFLNSGQNEIRIKVDAKAKTLIIEDTGVGLDEEDLVSSLGTIARSGTQSFIEQLGKAEDQKDKLNLIGQFGVGFYSAFMVASKVVVETRKVGSEGAFSWSSDGETGYEIEEAHKQEVGTSITLYLKKEAKDFLDEFRIKSLVKKYSDHIQYPIKLFGSEAKDVTVNSVEALWTKNTSKISSDDYKAFYNSECGLFDDPFVTIHNKSEGTVEFTALVFVPTETPFDLFDPQRKNRVKLYINRVFITEKIEGLLPNWLRFLRGIIDTSSLSLNVSREILQQSKELAKIKKVITKKVLSELKKKQKNDPEAFDVFWKKFGSVFKEGLYEDSEWREEILKIARFHSMKSEKLISLDDYVVDFRSKQSEIYYLTAENIKSAKRSPHLEGFIENSLDVLVLTDPIDEFWISMMPKFKDFRMISISREKIDLSEFDDETKIKNSTSDETEFQDLLSRIKSELGEKIKEAKVSKTLTSSPARLVADGGGFDFNLERIMKAQNPAYTPSSKVFEINPEHALIKSLANSVNIDDAFCSTVIQILFEETRLLEGEMPEDIGSFVENLNAVMEKKLEN